MGLGFPAGRVNVFRKSALAGRHPATLRRFYTCRVFKPTLGKEQRGLIAAVVLLVIYGKLRQGD